MDKINVTTVSAVATSATVVQAVIPEYQKSKAVIRRFSALGNDAACACNFYVPKACRGFRLPVALATAGTTLRIPVDVAGGHVFKGHTLASTDLLCLLTPTGWKVVSATYADNAGQTYCTATITAVGAIPRQHRVLRRRPRDRQDRRRAGDRRGAGEHRVSAFGRYRRSRDLRHRGDLGQGHHRRSAGGVLGVGTRRKEEGGRRKENIE